MAREYRILVCTCDYKFAGLFHGQGGEHQRSTITAYDSRDVEPLLRAVKRATTKLQSPARQQEPDAVAVALSSALAQFERGEEG